MKTKFTGTNGEFQSTQQLEPGHITIGYLEEMLEWLFYHNNMSKKEKLKNIINVEDMIKDLVKSQFDPVNAEYIPTWSKKLKNENTRRY